MDTKCVLTRSPDHQYSPANNAKVMLKLTAKQGNSFVFEFTSPSTKDADRSNVREIVSQVSALEVVFFAFDF